MTKIVTFFVLFGVSLFAVGCVNPLPASVDAVESDPAALALLADAARGHGGRERFARVQRIQVQYDGQWLGRVWVFQPVLVDRGYRGSSQETIVYRDTWPSTFQIHTGPDGEKRVLWPAAHPDEAELDGGGFPVPAGSDARIAFEPPLSGGAAVLYNGQVNSDQQKRALQEEAAAMVAEAYRMFLTAPFYFTQRGGRGGSGGGSLIAVMSTPEEVCGVMCNQVLLELRPGFGNSPVDRVQVAIARDTGLVRRVRFSLDGFSNTRGATADVELSGHVEVGGLTLPTEFLEIVTYPLNRKVHHWHALKLDVQFDSPAEQRKWTGPPH